MFATQRSGSTYLCERLHANGFGRGDEHILDYIHASEFVLLQTGAYSDEIAIRFELDQFVSKGAKNDRYCTKIMANYVHSFCGLLRNTPAVFDVDQQATLLGSTFGAAGYIFLYRPNRVAQAISRVIASQTGIWHFSGSVGNYVHSALPVDSRYNCLAVFQPTDILEQMKAIANEERQLGALHASLAAQGLPTLCILYDGARFLLPDNSYAAPLGLVTVLRRIQSGEGGKPSLSRLSNVYSQLFERAFYAYVNLMELDDARWSPMQQREAALAAVAECAEQDPAWVRMQTAALS